MIEIGVTDSRQIISQMRKILQNVPSIEIEYVSMVDAGTLEDVETVVGKILIAVAVKLGPARLIDNIMVDTDD
jgi:pantoate--beta-alanine ligase